MKNGENKILLFYGHFMKFKYLKQINMYFFKENKQSGIKQYFVHTKYILLSLFYEYVLFPQKTARTLHFVYFVIYTI